MAHFSTSSSPSRQQYPLRALRQIRLKKPVRSRAGELRSSDPFDPFDAFKSRSRRLARTSLSLPLPFTFGRGAPADVSAMFPDGVLRRVVTCCGVL
eukprot:1177855-Prorocentrum_minimum.AAC.1